MSREQDQKLVELYEKIVKGEKYKVGDKLLYIGDNKLLKGKKGTITKVGVGQVKFMFDHLNKEKTLETPLIKSAWKKVNEELLTEGAMKQYAFDLFDEIKNIAQKVETLAAKVKKVHKPAASHLRMAYHEIKQAGKKLPVEEEVSEGFANKIGKGKVPIGHFSFEYIPEKRSDIGFLIRSMKHRDPEEIIKLKNSVVMKAFAGQHQSLISSLQKLNFNGEVVDYNYKEKGVVVYQKEGK